MLLCSSIVDKFRLRIGMSRSTSVSFHGHPVEHNFHICCSVIMKLNNSSTPHLPEGQSASTECVKVKLYQQSSSGILQQDFSLYLGLEKSVYYILISVGLLLLDPLITQHPVLISSPGVAWSDRIWQMLLLSWDIPVPLLCSIFHFHSSSRCASSP